MSNEDLIRLYGQPSLGAPTGVGAMTDDQLKAAYAAAHPPSVGQDILQSAPSQLGEGGISLAGMPGDMSDLALRGADWIKRQVVGGEPRSEADLAHARLFPTSSELIHGYENVTGTKFVEPQTVPGKIVGAGLRMAPGGAALGGDSALVGAAKAGLAGIGGEAAGQGAEAIGLPKGAADAARLVTTLAVGGAAGLAKPRDVAPSRSALSDLAETKFKAADQAGVRLSQPAVERFADDAINTAAKAGFLDTPAARASLSPTPMTEAVLGIINDVSTKELTLSEAHRLRQAIGNAVSSAQGNDQRIVLMIRDKLDDWMEGLSQSDVAPGHLVRNGRAVDPAAAAGQLQDAIGLWSKVRKTDELGKMAENAKFSANPAKGYTYSEALRQEYKKLARSDRIRRFSPEEQDAIKKVANGGPIDLVAQTMATFYPFSTAGALRSGVLGAGLYQGGQGAAGAVFPAAGIFGKAAANALVRKNAAMADMLVRGGAGSVPTGAVMGGVPLAAWYGNMATTQPSSGQ